MPIFNSPRIWIAIAVVGVAFGFQNCAKPPQNLSSTSTSSQAEVSYKTSDAKEYSVLSVTDSAHGRVIDIDLNSGQSKIVSMHGVDSGQRRCLDSSLKAELSDLIEQAKVCEPVSKNRDGVVCTAIYEEAYASLKESSSIVSLGERLSGCDVAADLCGEAGIKLRQTVAKIKGKIDSLSCL